MRPRERVPCYALAGDVQARYDSWRCWTNLPRMHLPQTMPWKVCKGACPRLLGRPSQMRVAPGQICKVHASACLQGKALAKTHILNAQHLSNLLWYTHHHSV